MLIFNILKSLIMKYIYNIIIVVFIFTGLMSCTDELTSEPIGLLTLDQVESNPTITTIESSVSSSYQPLTSTLNSIVPGWKWDLGTVFRNDIVLQDIAANDMNKKWNPDGDQPWMDELADFSFTSENQAFNGIWVYDYEGINRINLAISYLTNSEIVEKAGLDGARKNQLLGEAYFLRAFYYFDLVNNFSSVPLVTTPSQSFEEAFEVSVRVPVDEVWALINSDLSDAKTILPDLKYPDASEPWRVSKGAVIALQAKVALFNENWTTVLSLISELDGLDFYSLNANYFDSFDADKEFTDDEVIFAYDHRSNETPNNNNGLRFVIGWGFFAPTDDFIAAFEANDPRLLYTVDITAGRASKIIGSTTDHTIEYGNKVYMRYADVLLWKAEALLETSDFAGAVAIINQIRTRARTGPPADGSVIPPGTLADRGSSTSQSEVKGWLMSERRVELGFEAQRFNDLKRWGTAKAVLTALGRNFQDHHYLYPIPQSDIDKSGGSIAQNTGY